MIKGKFCKPDSIEDLSMVTNALIEFGYGEFDLRGAYTYIGFNWDGHLMKCHRISHDTGDEVSVEDFIEMIIKESKFQSHPMFPPAVVVKDIKIRRFPTGAIRSSNIGRERYDFISPLAMKALAEYLATTENSFAQTNYFLGIPEDACVESLMRHLYDYQINGKKSEAIGVLFNAVALVHTIVLKERGEYKEKHKQTELINKSDFKNENESN